MADVYLVCSHKINEFAFDMLHSNSGFQTESITVRHYYKYTHRETDESFFPTVGLSVGHRVLTVNCCNSSVSVSQPLESQILSSRIQ